MISSFIIRMRSRKIGGGIYGRKDGMRFQFEDEDKGEEIEEDEDEVVEEDTPIQPDTFPPALPPWNIEYRHRTAKEYEASAYQNMKLHEGKRGWSAAKDEWWTAREHRLEIENELAELVAGDDDRTIGEDEMNGG